MQAAWPWLRPEPLRAELRVQAPWRPVPLVWPEPLAEEARLVYRLRSAFL